MGRDPALKAYGFLDSKEAREPGGGVFNDKSCVYVYYLAICHQRVGSEDLYYFSFAKEKRRDRSPTYPGSGLGLVDRSSTMNLKL